MHQYTLPGGFDGTVTAKATVPVEDVDHELCQIITDEMRRK